ncbi:AMP-binding protein [Mycolicibacterium goodii]|uniref:class I adenylate-forming enzyme family protein n=1 Tax=Mycolicibacterium goodii TaxID=134601 RepID=UPI001BDC6FDB|nr:AMP-binding protein [Mycolicibacterium goodii]MBU8816122.1 AMP-binding protein [Mycolicibacterium goodii]
MADAAVLAFGDREYTLAELDSLTGGMATALARRGVGPGERVAMMSSNRPEFVVALRAIWHLGAAAVLISPAWKSTEIAHALKLTRPTHAVGDHPLLAEHLPMLRLDEPITPGEHRGHTDMATPDADALFVFSSGTTGMPKAVCHSHAGFAAAIEHWRDALGLTAADRMQIMTPPSHILGLLNIAMVLDTGAWMRLHPRFDVDTMLRHIESDRITIEMAVAPIALALAAHPELERFDMSSLRYVMWCATPVTRSVAEDITARTGIRWLTAYGTTELPVIACNPLEDTRIETVGKPVRGVRVRIADTGEIEVCSPSVMRGYLPESATAGAFSDGSGHGWYRTGDIGFLDDDGYLHITDRAKEMIKVRGFQVAPAEVEAVLHAHPAVADYAVFGAPDAADGEAVVAAVATCAEVSADELIDLVCSRLASYKRPRRIEFVTEIPRLPSGKVLRRVLKERHGRPSDG